MPGGLRALLAAGAGVLAFRFDEARREWTVHGHEHPDRLAGVVLEPRGDATRLLLRTPEEGRSGML